MMVYCFGLFLATFRQALSFRVYESAKHSAGQLMFTQYPITYVDGLIYVNRCLQSIPSLM